jgi:predicted DNA-binding transcriptional regulator AlpA
MRAEMAKIRRPDAAKYLGISAATLAKWAVIGGGPPMYKISSAVVYDTDELDAWLAARRRESTSDRVRERV